jgi:Flp pilus assembly protein TadD
LAKGRVEEAWTAFEGAIENDPQDPRAWLDLGLVYEEMGDQPAAERAYRRSIEIDGNFAEPYNNVGVLLRERGALADAIPMLEQAAALDPRLGPARFNLALAYEDAGERDRAEREYLAAIQALPNDPVPRINLAMLYLDTDRLDEAADQLRAAVPQVRGDVLLSIAVGAGLRRAQDPEQAVEVLHGALEHASSPPPTELVAELALALYATGELQAAENTMRSAVKQAPRDPALHYALGTILVKRGKLDEARRHLQRVVRLDPNGPYTARARAQLRSIR